MKNMTLFYFIVLLLSNSCAAYSETLEAFIMDYPHGEDRILIEESGEAFLFYSARAQSKTIRKDVFSIDTTYLLFKKHLHKNTPRENWPNPKSEYGMVTLRYKDGSQEQFLIFDLNDLTDQMFVKARDNIIQTPGKK